MHYILHDYPDHRWIGIVEQIKGAMTPGYNKLLINENIIPAMGGNWEVTYLDLYIMVLISAWKRTVDVWHDSLEICCGLRVCKFWERESLSVSSLPRPNGGIS